MECPNCHTENNDTSRFCCSCGVPLGQGAGAGPERAFLTKTLETPLHILKPGTLIAGKYRIIDEVGAGGMGVVYKAEDLKLKRLVALKFLPPHLMDAPDLKERFLIEAQAAAARSHLIRRRFGKTKARRKILLRFTNPPYPPCAIKGELVDRVNRVIFLFRNASQDSVFRY